MIEWKQEIRQRLASLKLEPAREAEIVEELAQHLEDRCVELFAGAATQEEAFRAALVELSESESLERELRRVELPVPQEPIVWGANRCERERSRYLRRHRVAFGGGCARCLLFACAAGGESGSDGRAAMPMKYWQVVNRQWSMVNKRLTMHNRQPVTRC